MKVEKKYKETIKTKRVKGINKDTSLLLLLLLSCSLYQFVFFSILYHFEIKISNNNIATFLLDIFIDSINFIFIIRHYHQLHFIIMTIG